MDDKNNVKSESALREEAILNFWKENKIFSKTLSESKGRKEFVFYEGPPTANGKPGIHHLEARAFKDVIPRYKTMRGYHVRRKAGWDTHGLPVELEVEKELGLKSKKEIEEFGIAEFNERCKKSVWKYLDLWNVFTERIGYWVDQEHPYITYDKNYMESVWNVIKTIDDRKLLYKDYKVVPWCPRCGTGLSSHELAQGYQTVKDLSVYAKFKVVGQENTYILAWTTTPWTLPGNVALAVGEKIDYVKIYLNGEFLILAKDIFEKSKNNSNVLYSVIGTYFDYARITKDGVNIKVPYVDSELKGKDLVGQEYEPLYPFLQNTISDSEKPKLEKAFKVYQADFVTTEDGTGVVHTAVMYGQDDFVLGNELGLPKHHLVGLDGKFLTGTGFLEGRFVRDEEVAVDVIKDLAHRGLLFKKEKYEHTYPHCWRCKTALIYYARDSWYVKMSSLRDELVAENQKINWEPEYTKEGRFGEWLREVKDWAISRERFWGTPLPIWLCEECGEKHVVGSIQDIKDNVKKSGNKYFVVRHGEAENNISDSALHYQELNRVASLTEKGKKQVLESAKNFKEKIDVVISSPYNRSKETTKITCEQIGFPLDKVIYDDRIRELETSTFFEGKERTVFLKYYLENIFKKPTEILPGGESFAQLVKRTGDFIYELDKKYSGKNILIVGHQGAIRALSFVASGMSFNDLADKSNLLVDLKNAEIRKFDFFSLPHNNDFELDLHKPFVDDVVLVCSCGGEMKRVKEVMDVWFDSGTMPFSQDHYPFDFAQGKPYENKELLYPADYIAEAIDQTRGWFYTLLAVGVLMGRGTPYKNVICLGHILDAEGKKMSKSIGNVIDPWTMIEKYGVDTLRLWMYSVNQPGESKNFDEKTVVELHRQYFGLLYNVLAFYELYRDVELEKLDYEKSDDILDQWILARLDELNILCTTNLDKYRLLEPSRAIKDFISDLSTWYLRRSRDRIKEGDKSAKQTLYFVIKNLAKIIAPFAPFAADDIWIKLKNDKDAESVHLVEWPNSPLPNLPLTKGEEKEGVLEKMAEVRRIVSLGLQARQKNGIPVRQPLGQLRIKNYELGIEYTELIKDELNVKEIVEDKNIEAEVLLDTVLTKELKDEGAYRELVRAIQDIRKKEGLTPSDVIVLSLETNEEGKKLIQKFEIEIKKTVLASEIKFEQNNGEEAKINDLVFKITIQK